MEDGAISRLPIVVKFTTSVSLTAIIRLGAQLRQLTKADMESVKVTCLQCIMCTVNFLFLMFGAKSLFNVACFFFFVCLFRERQQRGGR